MRAQDKKAGQGRIGRWVRRIVALACVGAVGFAGYQYVYPMMAGAEQNVYTAYTAVQGDVTTTMSFSATISAENSETLQNSGEATVNKIYVTEDQPVTAGDKIIELSNGQTLTAGIDGTVNEISVSEGDWLWRSRSLVQIVDFTRLQVALNVDEYDVQKVRKGQSCTVRIISLGLDLETEIDHVNLVSSGMGNVASYSATAALDAPESVLPGMAATVTIPDEQVTDAVTLPVAALTFHSDGAAYVLMKGTDGTYTEQAVTTGLSDGTTVEITDGVQAGDTVWAMTGKETTEGFSLAKVYAALVGQTTVIQEGERSRNNRANRSEDAALPDGVSLPEGMNLPDGMTMPENVDFSGATPTDLGEAPENGTFPGGMTPPDGTFPSDSSMFENGGRPAGMDQSENAAVEQAGGDTP